MPVIEAARLGKPWGLYFRQACVSAWLWKDDPSSPGRTGSFPGPPQVLASSPAKVPLSVLVCLRHWRVRQPPPWKSCPVTPSGGGSLTSLCLQVFHLESRAPALAQAPGPQPLLKKPETRKQKTSKKPPQHIKAANACLLGAEVDYSL